jgi:hypothetical protein
LNNVIENNPPVISNQNFSIDENKPNGTIVGSVLASDPDPGQTISYTIIAGNINSKLENILVKINKGEDGDIVVDTVVAQETEES